MKALMRALKSMWFIIPFIWVVSMLLCIVLLPFWLTDKETLLIVMALITAAFLLLIILLQYRRIRKEHTLETLVRYEVDREHSTDQDLDILQERLQQAIGVLRTASRRGRAALSDLPWYLLIGASASGKTTLLTHSGLAVTIAGNTVDGANSGTQYCNWYFSREAVLIDTAGRYTMDNLAAKEFGNFLRLLKKQRRKPAINGLVLVVSLPELIKSTPQERHTLAERLLTRIDEYSECLNINPSIYLVLTKMDLLPGFNQAFAGLDTDSRQQPLGMTFSLAEVRQKGIRQAFREKYERLCNGLLQYVDGQLISQDRTADIDLLNFPEYFGELPKVLLDFLDRFERSNTPNGTPAPLRGLYFTSALQTSDILPPLKEQQISDYFTLQSTGRSADTTTTRYAQGDKSYFITDIFRKVIFPDRNLSLYYSRLGHSRLPGYVAVGICLLFGLGVIAWEMISFQKSRHWLAEVATSINALNETKKQTPLLQSNEALQTLRNHLQTIETQTGGAPRLFVDDAVANALRKAYQRQWVTQVLEPVTTLLQQRLRNLNAFVQNMHYILKPSEDHDATVTTSDRQRTPTNIGRGRQVRQNVQQAITQNVTSGSTPRSLNEATARIRTGLAKGLKDSLDNEQQTDTDTEETLSDAPDAPANKKTEGLMFAKDIQGRLTESQIAFLIESYQALKLYLILTDPNTYQDIDFVREHLPQAWLATQGENDTVEIPLSEDDIAMYLQYMQKGLAPAVEGNEYLISQARQDLKSLMISSTLVEREYLRMQLESNQRFAPLALHELVPAMEQDTLYSASNIPALYTAQGWETYFKPELIKLLTSQLQSEADWVLEGKDANAIIQKTNFIRDLVRLYKKDYAQVWSHFLATTGIRRVSNIGQGIEQLTLLSDMQKSPLKQLLKQVEENTCWDRPSNTEEKLEDSFLGRVRNALGITREQMEGLATALPKIHDGVLAKQFEPVAMLFKGNDERTGNNTPIIDGYLHELRALKVRLNNIQRSQDPGRSSKNLISETLAGDGSELNTTRNYVESHIDISQEGLSVSLQKLFISPVDNIWTTLQSAAGKQVAKAWDQQISRPWQRTLALRYPIASASHNESSVKDLQRFIDLLDDFKRREIGNLADEGSGRTASLINRYITQTIDHANYLSDVLNSLADNGFEIMIEPTRGLTDIILTIDGQVTHYRNGQTVWTRQVWPGNQGTPGARLDIINMTGKRQTVFDHRGQWGVLKMIDSARIQNLDSARQQFTWDSEIGPIVIVVRSYGGIRMTDLRKVKQLAVLNGTRGTSER